MAHSTRIIQAALVVLFALAALPTASRAEMGSIRVVFTKVGFVAGIGTGRGVLTFRGHNYPFKVSGASLGATIGASITKFVGRALNMRGAADIAGIHAAMGAGGALGGGVGGVQLENGSGVILQLHGVKGGMELSLNLAGITITMDRRSAS